jgi:hypothetical protein
VHAAAGMHCGARSLWRGCSRHDPGLTLVVEWGTGPGACHPNECPTHHDAQCRAFGQNGSAWQCLAPLGWGVWPCTRFLCHCKLYIPPAHEAALAVHHCMRLSAVCSIVSRRNAVCNCLRPHALAPRRQRARLPVQHTGGVLRGAPQQGPRKAAPGALGGGGLRGAGGSQAQGSAPSRALQLLRGPVAALWSRLIPHHA